MKSSSFISVAWLQFLTLVSASKPSCTYKVLYDESNLSVDDPELIIQEIGRNFFFRAKPVDIVNDDNLLKYFSAQDVRFITYLALQKIMQDAKYKIVAQEFSDDFQQEVFHLKKRNTQDEILVATASELVCNSAIMSNLSPEDARMVGYVAGGEYYANHLKKNNNK